MYCSSRQKHDLRFSKVAPQNCVNLDQGQSLGKLFVVQSVVLEIALQMMLVFKMMSAEKMHQM